MHREVFESRGLRCTRQRQLVYETLCHTASHPTADELYQMCSQRMPGLSLATVYNALEKLADAGLVHKLAGVGVNGSARYDAATCDHPHARCVRTGRIADLPDHAADKLIRNIPKRLLKELEEELGFKVEKVQIELLGEFVDARKKSGGNSHRAA